MGFFHWEPIKFLAVTPVLQVIFGLLLLIGIPLLLAVIWQIRRHQLARKAAMDMKRGNKIYSEWRRKGQPSKPDQ